jgi:hypothetical protein
MGVAMTIFVVLFFVAFFAILFLIFKQTFSVSRERTRQAAAPEVQAQARVVDKRVETLGPGNAGSALLASPNLVRVPMGDTSAYQVCRVTFEQAGGERFELSVPPDQYGLIVEGDSGTVTMKGGDLLSFSRELMR